MKTIFYKTRIKTVTYGDGTVKHYPQEKTIYLNQIIAYIIVPVLGWFCLILLIVDGYIPLYSDSNFDIFNIEHKEYSFEEAKQIIDKRIEKLKIEKFEHERQKLSNKIISKKFTKYP